jgi:preprotein translocase subunit SecF
VAENGSTQQVEAKEVAQMTAKRYLIDMAITAVIAFVVAMVVTYLYSLLVHGAGQVNWETTFDLAIIMGIVLPLVAQRRAKETGD